jgi:hypothetical protein
MLKVGDEEKWLGIGCRTDDLLGLDAFSKKASRIA